MIDFHNFKKHYNTQLILRIDELHLSEGIYWIQGKNGAGKTTLLNAIAGINPIQGNIRIMGVDQKKQSIPYRRLVNWAPAEPSYPHFLTGNDIIEFYVSTRKADRATIKKHSALFEI